MGRKGSKSLHLRTYKWNSFFPQDFFLTGWVKLKKKKFLQKKRMKILKNILNLFFINTLLKSLGCDMAEYSSTELEGYRRLCQRIDGVYCVHCEHSSVEELCPNQCRTCQQTTNINSIDRLRRQCIQLTGSYCIACTNVDVTEICPRECGICRTNGNIPPESSNNNNNNNNNRDGRLSNLLQGERLHPGIDGLPVENGGNTRMGFIPANQIIGERLTIPNRTSQFVAVPPGRTLEPLANGHFPVGEDYFRVLQEVEERIRHEYGRDGGGEEKLAYNQPIVNAEADNQNNPNINYSDDNNQNTNYRDDNPNVNLNDNIDINNENNEITSIPQEQFSDFHPNPNFEDFLNTEQNNQIASY